MQKLFLVLAIFCFAIPTAEAKTLNILTTTADLKSITEYIGGNKVKVDSLANGSQNYHFLAAKPSYMIKARNADLFIRNGLDLEIGYESLILEGSRNRRIQIGQPGHLDASRGIIPLEIPSTVDRSLGDIHPLGNPHYWLDPLNIKNVAGNITGRLSELSSQDSAYFQNNLSEFNRRIDSKMKEWAAKLAPFQGEKLLSYHKSWAYFAHRFGFEMISELEPKPGIPPSPSHLSEIIELILKENIKIILNENIYPHAAADYLAQKTQARVVIAPISVGGVQGTADYFSLIDVIVAKLADGFNSKKKQEGN